MMIMSALMPLVGYMASITGFTATFWVFAAITGALFIVELLM
jgi:hypothetical protein